MSEKTEVFANSELEIVAEKRPKKEIVIENNKRQENSRIFAKILIILAKNSRNLQKSRKKLRSN